MRIPDKLRALSQVSYSIYRIKISSSYEYSVYLGFLFKLMHDDVEYLNDTSSCVNSLSWNFLYIDFCKISFTWNSVQWRFIENQNLFPFAIYPFLFSKYYFQNIIFKFELINLMNRKISRKFPFMGIFYWNKIKTFQKRRKITQSINRNNTLSFHKENV